MTSIVVRFAPRHGYSLFKRGKPRRQTYLSVDQDPSKNTNKVQGNKKRKRAASSTNQIQSETFFYPWADTLLDKQYEKNKQWVFCAELCWQLYLLDCTTILWRTLNMSVQQIRKCMSIDSSFRPLNESWRNASEIVPFNCLVVPRLGWLYPSRTLMCFLYYEPNHPLWRDLDITVSTRYVPEDANRGTYLRQLSSRLRNAGLTDRVSVRAKAKVPILTFTTSPQYGGSSFSWLVGV